MFSIKIADIVVSIDNKYSFIEQISKDYIVQDAHTDIAVSITEAEIEKERSYNKSLSDPFIESVCIYRAIAEQLPEFDAFVLHCASIEYNNSAFCFLGKSGTGKTTHIKLWRSVYGDSILPINGDKPIIRLINDTFYVCGTPWGGKEMLQRNVMIPLRGMCELSQANENTISKCTPHKAFGNLMSHSFISENKANFERTVSLMAEIVNRTNMWHLKCNISKEAAMMSFEQMNKE